MRKISLFAFIITVFACTKTPPLPIFGEREFDGTDTIYHEIGSFYFLNQDGKEITEKEYKNQIYIANFFFTTCPGICPSMTNELTRVQQVIKEKSLPVKLLSHTVDPESDSLPVLKAYGEKNSADFKTWNFVSGSKKNVYELALQYLVVAQEDTTLEIPFVHSDKLILIDKKARIRGMYSGIDPKEVDLLIEDVQRLLKENE